VYMYVCVYVWIGQRGKDVCIPVEIGLLSHECCGSVLQRVAACCSVLQCVAYPLKSACSLMSAVAVCCSVLQCVAVCCNVLHTH